MPFGTKGTKVLFTNSRDDFAIVFRSDVDDPEHIEQMVAKFAADGYYPVRHEQVIYTRQGWVKAVKEPTLRQRLGMRPVLKVA